MTEQHGLDDEQQDQEEIQAQSPLVQRGAPPDPDADHNEVADDKVRVVQPDGSDVPRAD